MKIFPRPSKEEVKEAFYVFFAVILAFLFYLLLRSLGFDDETSQNYMYSSIYVGAAACIAVCLLRWHFLVRARHNKDAKLNKQLMNNELERLATNNEITLKELADLKSKLKIKN